MNELKPTRSLSNGLGAVVSYTKYDVRAEVDSGDASAWPEVMYP